MAALCVIFQGRKEAPEHGKPFRLGCEKDNHKRDKICGCAAAVSVT
jgi:hypothetical protein